MWMSNNENNEVRPINHKKRSNEMASKQKGHLQ